MNGKIYLGLIAFPIFLYNASPSFASNSTPVLRQNSPLFTEVIVTSINARLHMMSLLVSARDDQTEDCLRAGSCKD
jgi:hypothetical protein